jgi:hypothetical protein
MKSPVPALARRLAAATTLILMLGAALTGCGPGNGSPVSSAAPGPATRPAGAGSGSSALASCSSYPGAKSCYFLTVTAAGAQAFHGTDTIPNLEPCGAVLSHDAASNAGEVQLSAPVFITGPVAAFYTYLDKYHGPGTYTTAGSDADVQFLLGTEQYDASGSGSAVTAVAGANGSVSVTFTKLAGSAGPAKNISGHAQFTCRNT